MRTPLLAANWKMHKTIPEAEALVGELLPLLAGVEDREVVLCPPFPALAAVASICRGSRIAVGAQNLHWEAQGAYTGEVSAPMLRAAGCSFVIVGHSERRQYFGEDDAMVNRKLEAAIKTGLHPILCVGETLSQRELGLTRAVCELQLRQALAGIDERSVEGLVVAYEPVWAIGTGRTPTPEETQAVIAFLRRVLAERYSPEVADRVRVLYGGSVTPENIRGFMAQPDIDGALVGGASLKAETFAAIVRY
ncbi:MAG: triose-phosphate isomerase [Moorellales bacterium]